MKITTANFGDVWLWPYCSTVPQLEAFEWATFISESHAGTDVVTQVRNAPRWTVELESVLGADRAAAAYAIAHAGAGEVWAMPVWAEAERVSVTAGATSVPVSIGHYHEDGMAILWKSYREWQLLEIDGAVSGSLSLLDPVEESYSNALLMPVRVGRLVQATTVNQNAKHSWFRLQFLASDNRVLPSTEPAQYLGNDLYLDCPLLDGDGVPDEIFRRQDMLDGRTGLVSYNSPWACARRQRTFRRFMGSNSERMDMLDWLHRRAGRYRPFWAPTWTQDLRLVSMGMPADSIAVINDGFSGCRSHIAVRTRDGEWYPREVLEAEESGDNLILLLDAELTMDAGDVTMISYLGLHRLASDRIEIEALGNERYMAGIPVIEADIASGVES